MYSHLKDTVHILLYLTYAVVVVVTWYILVGEEVDDDVILVMLEEHDQGWIHLCPHSTNCTVNCLCSGIILILCYFYTKYSLNCAVMNVERGFSTIISQFIRVHSFIHLPLLLWVMWTVDHCAVFFTLFRRYASANECSIKSLKNKKYHHLMRMCDWFEIRFPVAFQNVDFGEADLCYGKLILVIQWSSANIHYVDRHFAFLIRQKVRFQGCAPTFNSHSTKLTFVLFEPLQMKKHPQKNVGIHILHN